MARVDTRTPSLDDTFLTLTGTAPVTPLTGAGNTDTETEPRTETARSAA